MEALWKQKYPHTNSPYKFCPLTCLPTDLLNIIVNHLSTKERYPLYFVSKRLRHLNEVSSSIKKGSYEIGIISGSIPYLEWIKQQNYPLTALDFAEAAKQGRIEVLIWL